MPLSKLSRKDTTIPLQPLKPKILQFGEGNFLRAFVDWMVYEMNRNTDFNGCVHVVQPLPVGMTGKLNAQDGLFNLYLNGIKEGQFISNHSLIDVIQKSIDPYEDFDLYLEEASNPDLKFIISNTTESGIQFNPADRLEDKPASSFPGKLTQLFYKRFKKIPEADKIVVLPCELIDKNGDILKSIILKYVVRWELGDDFYHWINEKVVFCNTLVDRIVPGYPHKNVADYWDKLGFKDELIVEGELFHLWVIEGPEWIKNELPVEQSNLNVVFTNDLNYYRTRKVRILNGAHTTMVPVAYLYGLDFVQESVENSLIGEFIRRAIFGEIVPSIKGDKIELEKYANEVLDRFRNPSIEHELISISLNSFSKFKTRVLPSILAYYGATNQLPELLTVSFASLIYFYKGDRFGTRIPLKDDEKVLALLSNLWNDCDGSVEAANTLVKKVLSNQELWSDDLTLIPGLTESISNKLFKIQQKGTGKLLQDIMHG